MQPTTSRDFLKVARQRLSATDDIAKKLLLTLEAQYIGGYSIECSLKALILEKAPVQDRPALLLKLTCTAKSHRPEVLRGKLGDLGIFLTPRLAKRMRRLDWTTDLRYETGRKNTGETNGLLRTAREIYNWVEAQIP
jgi:hypothetical protein